MIKGWKMKNGVPSFYGKHPNTESGSQPAFRECFSMQGRIICNFNRHEMFPRTKNIHDIIWFAVLKPIKFRLVLQGLKLIFIPLHKKQVAPFQHDILESGAEDFIFAFNGQYHSLVLVSELGFFQGGAYEFCVRSQAYFSHTACL